VYGKTMHAICEALSKYRMHLKWDWRIWNRLFDTKTMLMLVVIW